MTQSLKEDGRPATLWFWDDWFSSFDVRACSLGARGLWIDMLGIMARSEIKGTLSINGKQVINKTLAQISGTTEAEVECLVKELEENLVFSRLPDGTIINRRMFDESQRQDRISKIKSEAGKRGAEARWQTDGKDVAEQQGEGMAKGMAKMALSNQSNPNQSNPIKKDIVSSIVSYLNEKAGKNFSDKSENTINLISGRLSEGRTIEDFKKVIDTKVKKWKGDPKMDDYLRPDTLFRPSNFESYLNEKPIEKVDDGREWARKKEAEMRAKGEYDDEAV